MNVPATLVSPKPILRPILVNVRLVIKTADLVDRIVAEIERFVFLKEQKLYRFLAIWILASHLHQQFEYFGYFMISSRTKGCGKSSLLAIMRLLIWKPSAILINPTRAVLFRTAQCHSQIMDEVDQWPQKTDLNDILNAGFQRMGEVLRMRKSQDGNYDHHDTFYVYSPKILSGIRVEDRFHDMTLDRTFRLVIEKQTRGERRERIRRNKLAGFESLRVEIEQWANDNSQRVREVYEAGNFPYLEEFDDRTIDVSEPLAAVVEILNPDLRGDLLHGIALTRQEEGAKKARAILERLLENCPVTGSSSELAAECFQGDLSRQGEISRLLRQHGFKSKSIRNEDGTPGYRYELTQPVLEEILTRYYPI